MRTSVRPVGKHLAEASAPRPTASACLNDDLYSLLERRLIHVLLIPEHRGSASDGDPVLRRQPQRPLRCCQAARERPGARTNGPKVLYGRHLVASPPDEADSHGRDSCFYHSSAFP